MNRLNCITVLGTTASGKTRLACELAYELDAEIISADSRQVYTLLDIGTGKDLQEYMVAGKAIPYHLIDLIPPEEQFYLHQFVEALERSFTDIRARNKLPIICGGTGLYLDALQKDFSHTLIPENETLRKALEGNTKEQLLQHLSEYPRALTKHVDTHSAKRLLRGIEVADHYQRQGEVPETKQLPYHPFYIGIQATLETRKQLISERLARRLETGLIAEVESLLAGGLSAARLEKLGLEYKFVLYYLQNRLSKEQLFTQLQTAIFQFAKRQMTWFRKMEKEGTQIHWVNKEEPMQALLEKIKAAGL